MFDAIKKLRLLLNSKQKRGILLLFFVSCISAALEVVGVSMILPLVKAIMDPDIINKSELIHKVCIFFHISDFKSFAIFCIIVLILVFVFKDLFLMFQIYVQSRFVCNNRLAMQQYVMNAFLNKPYEYYLNASSGEIFRVIQGDVAQTFTILTAILSLASDLVVSFALVITTFVIDPVMTGIVAVVLALLAIIILKIVKPLMKKAGKEYQYNVAHLNKWLLQAVQGIKEAKVIRRESFFADKHLEYGGNLAKTERMNTLITQTPRLLIEMFAVCSMLTAMAVQIVMGRDIGSMMPSLSAFAVAAIKLMPSANRIVTAVNNVSYNKPAIDNLIVHMKEFEEGTGTNGKIGEKVPAICENKLSFSDKIELKDITYSYPNTDKLIFDKADMLIPIGKSIGIVGPSGSGKTTAVDILLGLLPPSQGNILCDGVDVFEHYDEWLSNIGYISQMIFMLDESIRENVAFGVAAEDIDEDRVWSALREAQLEDYVRSLPEGLDTTIGERGIRISGGQRQRIGIARALYNDPQILVFDEATSALDNDTEAAIMEAIDALHGKKTIIIIAHRLQTIEGCDMVYRVSDGKIVKER